jgi:hypothetical protein
LPPDKIIWNGTSNGMFSVKSAYHMAGSAQPVMAIVFSGKKKFGQLKLQMLQKNLFGELVKMCCPLNRIC